MSRRLQLPTIIKDNGIFIIYFYEAYVVSHKLTVRAREAFYFTPVMLRKTWIERERYRKVHKNM